MHLLFKKKYLAFFSVTAAVLVTALVRVPCPVAAAAAR
jgi:hypothetical protein